MDTSKRWDTPTGRCSMGKRKFTREFKIEAVRQATRGGRSQAAVARDLGISANLLARWKQQLEEEGKAAFPGQGHLKPEDEERRRLEREVRQLREENEFLKKTAAFFASLEKRGTK
jgi:transposase